MGDTWSSTRLIFLIYFTKDIQLVRVYTCKTQNTPRTKSLVYVFFSFFSHSMILHKLVPNNKVIKFFNKNTVMYTISIRETNSRIHKPYVLLHKSLFDYTLTPTPKFIRSFFLFTFLI